MIAEGLTTARGNQSVMYLKAEKKQPVPGGGTGCIRQLTEGACELEAGYCLAVLIGGDENHGPDIHSTPRPDIGSAAEWLFFEFFCSRKYTLVSGFQSASSSAR